MISFSTHSHSPNSSGMLARIVGPSIPHLSSNSSSFIRSPALIDPIQRSRITSCAFFLLASPSSPINLSSKHPMQRGEQYGSHLSRRPLSRTLRRPLRWLWGPQTPPRPSAELAWSCLYVHHVADTLLSRCTAVPIYIPCPTAPHAVFPERSAARRTAWQYGICTWQSHIAAAAAAGPRTTTLPA